jgi:redox-sensitive bicupin YhaK (pirin superfamily)
MTRTIERSVRGMKTSDGAGVKLTRLIGTPVLRSVDPFLMLDDFGSDNPDDYIAGFPEHPHRGFETITYMIQGRFRHRDNKGNEVVSDSGSAQWMTAGRGIVHAEIPEQREGAIRGFQLWLNLPAKDKLRDPEYRAFERDRIPLAKLDGGAEARVLGGRVGGVEGPIAGRATEPIYVDVSLAAGTSGTIPVPPGHKGFLYVFEGSSVLAGGKELARGELGVLTDGDSIHLEAKTAPVRVLLVAGKPLREPVVQYGPFVMNTPEEIEQAIADFQAGRF